MKKFLMFAMVGLLAGCHHQVADKEIQCTDQVLLDVVTTGPIADAKYSHWDWDWKLYDTSGAVVGTVSSVNEACIVKPYNPKDIGVKQHPPRNYELEPAPASSATLTEP
jgi:hypothetical protein